MKLFSTVLFALFVSSSALAQKIYWTDVTARKIQRANIDGSGMEDLVVVPETGIVFPSGITLDSSSGKMYWTDSGTDKIHRANFDGSQIQDLLALPNSLNPRSPVLDSVLGKLYWLYIDSNGPDSIRRINLDGSGLFTIVGGFTALRSMAIDFVDGKIYFANASQIQRVNLDGSGFETLIANGLGEPNGLCLDLSAGKIYWTDAVAAKIQRANLDGSNVENLITSGLSIPDGLALDISQGKMYWANAGLHKIQRANLNGTQVEDVVSNLQAPRAIALDLIPRIVSSVPPNCAIDAREPHSIQNSQLRSGWQSLELNFSFVANSISLADFSLNEFGGDGIAPAIQSFEMIPSNTLRLNFSETIQAGAWTCLTFLPSNTEICLAALPADVNADRFATPVDILQLINQLNGVINPPLPIHQTDINRSGLAEPSDILREIDLLNGAGEFIPWNGASLPACPN